MKLEDAVREAHTSNIEMFVIGVVNQSDPFFGDFKRELNTMGSDPDDEHVFVISDFNTLPGMRNRLWNWKYFMNHLIILCSGTRRQCMFFATSCIKTSKIILKSSKVKVATTF